MSRPLSVREMVLAVRRGEPPRAFLRDCVGRINSRKDLNAFLWVNQEGGGGDATVGAAAPRPLEGVPIALKDNIDTRGIPTTSGSPVDAGRVPEVDAAVWARLRDRAGMSLAGKTHMSEFAYRSHNPTLGRPKNPHRADRASGGSSSGSAVAVAAGLVPAALGSDTGGSVRIPAAYCGVVGLKGTYGLVETAGLVPLSQTMDHVGVLASSVTDAALVLEQMSVEPLRLVDPDALEVPLPDPRTVRLGVPVDYLGTGAQAGVLRSWRESVRRLGEMGCEAIPIELPAARRWRAAHKVLILCELWRNLSPRAAAGAPYGAVLASTLRAGSRITRRQYEDALATRAEAGEAMARLFATGIDLVTTPTCPTVAPLGDQGTRGTSYTRYTTLAALTGLPAISVPVRANRTGLPIGLQLVAPAQHEARLLGVAALVENAQGRR